MSELKLIMAGVVIGLVIANLLLCVRVVQLAFVRIVQWGRGKGYP